MSQGTFENPAVAEEELDILLIGGGMACCGAAYEMMRWAEAVKAETGNELRIKLVDKAAMDRSGAVAQGLSAINTYIGPEQDPADYARMVSNDLMGITRDDLAYDLGRNVDDSVHLFEEWGLPIWKTDDDGVRHDGAESINEGLPLLKDGGKPVRSGKWQIMINGESYKWIVAEAAKKALGLSRIEERVFIVKLINDKNDPSRIAGAVGFSVRTNTIHVYKAKAVLLAAGGCVNLFRPRSVGEGTGRAWYPVWNAGSTYAMAAEAGAEMTMMENRFVPARFKDGYGPVGAWFLLFKARATNGYGEDYLTKNKRIACINGNIVHTWCRQRRTVKSFRPQTTFVGQIISGRNFIYPARRSRYAGNKPCAIGVGRSKGVIQRRYRCLNYRQVFEAAVDKDILTFFRPFIRHSCAEISITYGHIARQIGLTAIYVSIGIR